MRAVGQKGNRKSNLKRGWISAADRLPKNEEPVLVCVEDSVELITGQWKHSRFIVMAFYTDGTMYHGDSAYDWTEYRCDDEFYDEEKDDFIIPEGWYERTCYTDEFNAVDDKVIYWMPLPELPVRESRKRK